MSSEILFEFFLLGFFGKEKKGGVGLEKATGNEDCQIRVKDILFEPEHLKKKRKG